MNAQRSRLDRLADSIAFRGEVERDLAAGAISAEDARQLLTMNEHLIRSIQGRSFRRRLRHIERGLALLRR